MRGDGPDSRAYFPNSWNLHLAYEAAGIPVARRELPFRFRSDLPLPGADPPLRFEDVAARMGVNKFDGLGPSAWGDYDGDGDFDLFTCGCDSYGALYRNDGDRFRDVSVEAGLLDVQSGFSATFQDYDNDGYRDLYIGRGRMEQSGRQLAVSQQRGRDLHRGHRGRRRRPPGIVIRPFLVGLRSRRASRPVRGQRHPRRRRHQCPVSQ